MLAKKLFQQPGLWPIILAGLAAILWGVLRRKAEPAAVPEKAPLVAADQAELAAEPPAPNKPTQRRVVRYSDAAGRPALERHFSENGLNTMDLLLLEEGNIRILRDFGLDGQPLRERAEQHGRKLDPPVIDLTKLQLQN